MVETSYNSDWSEFEVNLCVDSYLKHLKLQIDGVPFSKAALYRDLSKVIGRTESSIEFKFQNISAVLNEIGYDWLRGLAPLKNYQKILFDAISARYQDIAKLDYIAIDSSNIINDVASFFIEPAPERTASRAEKGELIDNIVKKFNPMERDQRNRALGEAGEKLVYEYEKRLLISNGRKELSENVRWVSKVEGDGAGYDILSFDLNGTEKHIEVKTTIGGNRTPFYISRNELEYSKRNPDKYTLFRLFNFRSAPRGFELLGSIEQHVNLSSSIYRADFN